MVLWDHDILGVRTWVYLPPSPMFYWTSSFFTLRPCPEPRHVTLAIIALDQSWWCEIREHKCLTAHFKFKSHFMGISKICEDYVSSQVFCPMHCRREKLWAEEVRQRKKWTWDGTVFMEKAAASPHHLPGEHVLGKGQHTRTLRSVRNYEDRGSLPLCPRWSLQSKADAGEMSLKKCRWGSKQNVAAQSWLVSWLSEPSESFPGFTSLGKGLQVNQEPEKEHGSRKGLLGGRPAMVRVWGPDGNPAPSVNAGLEIHSSELKNKWGWTSLQKPV